MARRPALTRARIIDAAAAVADDQGLTGISMRNVGKQLGVEASGWREAAGHYGEDGCFASVADITGAESLAKVRATKQAAKAAAKAAKA